VMENGTSPSASLMVLSPLVPSPPGREEWHHAALPLSRISSTSSAGFFGMKSMQRLRHAEEGEHLQGEEHFVLLG
jgi:hypothetical protein